MISRDNRNAYAEERQPQMYDSILNGCFCSCICRSYIETVLAVGSVSIGMSSMLVRGLLENM